MLSFVINQARQQQSGQGIHFKLIFHKKIKNKNKKQVNQQMMKKEIESDSFWLNSDIILFVSWGR